MVCQWFYERMEGAERRAVIAAAPGAERVWNVRLRSAMLHNNSRRIDLMKKVLLISLVILLVLFSGCGKAVGGSGRVETNPKPTEGAEETAQPVPEVPEATEITDGTFTVLSLEDGELIIRLESSAMVNYVELAAGDEKIAAKTFSNLDASMQISGDGYVYNAGRIACYFELPEGFVPDTLYITGKAGSEPAVLDISALSGGTAPKGAAPDAEAYNPDALYIYVGTLVYDDIEFTVQNGSYFEDLGEEYFLTAGGSFHYSNGSTLWAGSTLSTESIRNTTDYQKGTLMAFTFKSELKDEALQAAFETFAESMKLFDGEKLLDSTHQIYGSTTVGILFPGKVHEGQDIWFRVGDGKNVLSPQG